MVSPAKPETPNYTRNKRRSRGVDPTIDPNSVQLDQRLTLCKHRDQQQIISREVKEAFMNFLREAPSLGKDVIKYRILGNLVACIRSEGECWLSSAHLVTIQLALLQLHTNQQTPRDRRRITDYILAIARGNKNADIWEVVEGDSPQLRHLYLHGAVKNLKRQRIFRWDRVNHEQLHAEVMSRFGMKSGPAVVRRSSESAESWSSGLEGPNWTMQIVSPAPSDFESLSVLGDAVEMLK